MPGMVPESGAPAVSAERHGRRGRSPQPPCEKSATAVGNRPGPPWGRVRVCPRPGVPGCGGRRRGGLRGHCDGRGRRGDRGRGRRGGFRRRAVEAGQHRPQVVGEGLGAVLEQALGDGGVADAVDAVGEPGADRVEVDVRHGGDHGLVGEQRAGVEALFEEVAGAVVLEVGASRDGLLEMLHEVGHGAEGAPGAGDAAGVVEDEFAAFGLAFVGDGAVLGGRERLDPAVGDLDVGPVAVGEGIVAEHEVEVVGEHGVGRRRRRRSRSAQAVDEPGAAVRAVAAGERVDAAQEGAAHAAGDEVVVALVDGIDQQMSGGRHAGHGPRSGAPAVSAERHGRRGRSPQPPCEKSATAVGNRPGTAVGRVRVCPLQVARYK